MATVTLASATPASGATIHASDFTNVPVTVTLSANQPQNVALGPYKFVNSVGAIAKSTDCPLPFTVTVVSFEFSNPSLFNTGTALTYTFVP